MNKRIVATTLTAAALVTALAVPAAAQTDPQTTCDHSTSMPAHMNMSAQDMANLSPQAMAALHRAQHGSMDGMPEGMQGMQGMMDGGMSRSMGR